MAPMLSHHPDQCFPTWAAWVIHPFVCTAEDQELGLLEEIIELQNDEESKQIFNSRGHEAMWLKHYVKFPALRRKAKLPYTAFPSSYLAERGFSAVNRILVKDRNCLDVVNRRDLRLLLSKFSPDILKFAKNRQAQGSHQCFIIISFYLLYYNYVC
jgi:hypothetical protein